MPEGPPELALPDHGGYHPIDPIQEIASSDPYPGTSIVSECTREDVDRATCRILAEINEKLYIARMEFEWDAEESIIIVKARLGITLPPSARIELRERFFKIILLANREGWHAGFFSYEEDLSGTVTPVFEEAFPVTEVTERVDIQFLFESITYSCLHLTAALEEGTRTNGWVEDIVRTAFSIPKGNA